MPISKIIYKSSSQATGEIWMDSTPATAAAADILAPKTALLANGVLTTGTGTGGGGAEEKDVNFIDYDGTILYSYTAADFASLSALPANPSHTGLTAKGWNWSLSYAKTYVASYGKLWIGQMYTTVSGATEIDIALDNSDYLSPYLAIAVNGTVVVDWGDNSSTDTMTGTSNTTLKYQQHIYASTGNYTIKLTVTSGGFAFYNSSSSYVSILRTINAADTRASSKAYSITINELRLGSGANIGNYAFANCDSLQSITIPSTVTSIASGAFYNCRDLMSITIPSDVTNIDNSTFYECNAIRNISIPRSVTSIGNTVFYRCYGLTSVTIPSSVTSIGYSVFQYCCNLTSITIPSGVTSIGSTTFQYCYKLLNMTIPSTVTSIGNTAFSGCNSLQSIMIPSSITSIDSNLFQNCYTLTSITIPSTVTSIGNTVFSNCYNLRIYHLLPTSVPTLGTSSIAAKSGTIIYVPYSADHSILQAYKTATNWSTYASYMQEEPQ